MIDRGSVERRIWRGAADTRRRLTRRGRAPRFDVSPRGDLGEWHDWSAAHVGSYRREHPPAAGRVAVLCVSMRPRLIDAVAANVVRQVDVGAELVFVPNHPEFRTVDVASRFRDLDGVSVVDVEPGTSLGTALNRAMGETSARFVAKFDDDDRYGPHHLVDSLRAHAYAGAGVVGKHTYYAEFESSGERVLRFPGNEFRYSSTLVGGTLVIDRERTGDLTFDDISLGEDRAFIAACHRRGVSTFAADRFNFLQARTGTNTWAIDDATFRSGTVPVDGSTEIDR